MIELKCGGDWDSALSDLISGKLYFQDGENCFPALDWNDFPIAVLEGWYETLTNSFRRKQKFWLFFLDGPYAVRLKKRFVNKQLYFEIAMINNFASDRSTVAYSCCIPAWKWFAEMARAADTCVLFCRQHGYPADKLCNISGVLCAMKNIYS